MNHIRLVRFPEVRARVGLSRTTIWRLCRAGSFPKPSRLSARSVGWVEAEIEAWIRARVAAARSTEE